MNKGGERERERWLLPFPLRSFRFFFSCVGVLDLTEEDEEGGRHVFLVRQRVVLCCVLFVF